MWDLDAGSRRQTIVLIMHFLLWSSDAMDPQCQVLVWNGTVGLKRCSLRRSSNCCVYRNAYRPYNNSSLQRVSSQTSSRYTNFTFSVIIDSELVYELEQTDASPSLSCWRLEGLMPVEAGSLEARVEASFLPDQDNGEASYRLMVVSRTRLDTSRRKTNMNPELCVQLLASYPALDIRDNAATLRLNAPPNSILHEFACATLYSSTGPLNCSFSHQSGNHTITSMVFSKSPNRSELNISRVVLNQKELAKSEDTFYCARIEVDGCVAPTRTIPLLKTAPAIGPEPSIRVGQPPTADVFIGVLGVCLVAVVSASTLVFLLHRRMSRNATIPPAADGQALLRRIAFLLYWVESDDYEEYLRLVVEALEDLLRLLDIQVKDLLKETLRGSYAKAAAHPGTMFVLISSPGARRACSRDSQRPGLEAYQRNFLHAVETAANSDVNFRRRNVVVLSLEGEDASGSPLVTHTSGPYRLSRLHETEAMLREWPGIDLDKLTQDDVKSSLKRLNALAKQSRQCKEILTSPFL